MLAERIPDVNLLLRRLTIALLVTTSMAGAVRAQEADRSLIQVPEAAQPQEGFADLVEAVSPAVVSILVEGEGESDVGMGSPELPEGYPFGDFLDRFGDRFGGPGSEQIEPPRRFMGAGSGFFISEDGYIVTNNHVIENATEVTVLLDSGEERAAEIIGADERTDLAVLKIDGENLPFVGFEDDRSETRVGDWVVAVGNPFGLGGTVTVGVISGIGRDIGGSNYGDFLQIDAAVNTGNSGGPAFNTDGEVVGVNTAIYSPTGGNVGIAFAVPAATVQEIVQQLIETGTVTRGFLGVSIQDVTQDIAESLGLRNARGAIVSEPSEGSPAEAAGLQSGDVIIQVDDDQIEDALDLSRTIASAPPGTEITLTVWRDGSEQELQATLDVLAVEDDTSNRPLPPADADPIESLFGLSFVNDPEGDEGLRIADIAPGSVAAHQGLRPDDVVVEVQGTLVDTVEEFEAAVEELAREEGRKALLVKVRRDDGNRFIALPLEEEET